MKKLFASIAIALTALTLAAGSAHAKRLGSGKTSGKQSATAQKQAAAPAAAPSAQSAPTAAPAKPAAPAAAAPAAPNRSKWLGPLAGLAAGLGIAALLSHFGMGGAMGEMLSNMLMIGLFAFAALMAWRWFKNRNAATTQPAMAFAGTGAASNAGQAAFNPSAQNFQAAPQHANTFDAAPAAALGGTQTETQAEPAAIPAGFDSEGFVRNAKVYFIRLQAAWDARNLHDIKEFTTPEMYAEIKMEMAEDSSKNETDVVELNAQMLAVESDAHEHTASVRFYGQTRENGASPAAFNEIWNLTKPMSGAGGWVLAGITQL